MHTFLSQLLGGAAGGHLLEYSLLTLGISVALVEPSLAISVLQTVTDAIRMMLLQVAAML